MIGACEHLLDTLDLTPLFELSCRCERDNITVPIDGGDARLELAALLREEGELAVDRISEIWRTSQTEMFGDSVELSEGYDTWWSYIPHFINTPGYVYAYAYGQLLALSVYRRYEEEGMAFVPSYLDLLKAGLRKRRV